MVIHVPVYGAIHLTIHVVLYKCSNPAHNLLRNYNEAL